jgi:hypothetical protein
LRLNDGRLVAIYLRDGAASVAVFSGTRGRLMSVGEWHCSDARTVALAQRRGEVDILSPIPGDVVARIEALHRTAELNDHPFKRKTLTISAAIRAWLARAWTGPATLGSRMMGAAAFRVD